MDHSQSWTMGVATQWAALLVVIAAAVRGLWSPCGLSMVSAINPFSERARGHRYGLTAAWFVLGSLAGGGLLGTAAAALAWVASPLPPAAATGLVALCALVTLAGDARLGGFRLPEHPRQVNELWLGRYRRWVYASGFGFQIGTGFATYIMTAAVYLVPVLGISSGSPATGLALGMLFGLVRGMAGLVSAPATDPDRLRSLHRRLAAWEPWSLRAAMCAQALAVLAFAGVVGWPALSVAAVALLAIAVGARIGRPAPGHTGVDAAVNPALSTTGAASGPVAPTPIGDLVGARD